MAALVTLSGRDVLDCTVVLPRIGVWYAHVMLAELEPFDGQRATLQFGPNLQLTGAVRRSGSADGVGVLILIGGAGGLYRFTRTQAYRQAPLRLPLNDLLASAEETLSGTADPSLLNTELAQWAVTSQPVAHALSQLMEFIGADWRVLPDGTVWIGQDSWEDTPSFNFLGLAERPAENSLLVYSAEPAVLPGQTFQGRHVSAVHHTLRDDDLESVVYLEAA